LLAFLVLTTLICINIGNESVYEVVPQVLKDKKFCHLLFRVHRVLPIEQIHQQKIPLNQEKRSVKIDAIWHSF
jgi:hypothetical protein